MEETIETKLNRLADYQSAMDMVNLHYDDLRNAILTPEIQAALADIEAEREASLQSARTNIQALTDEIKWAVVDAGKTVSGMHLQAVYTKGRVSWDTKALDGYAAGHPEIAQFRKVGQPSVSIRVTK